MALVQSILTSKLIDGFSSHNPSSQIAALKIVDSFKTYISSASNVGSGNFTNITGINTLNSKLVDIFSQQYPSGIIVGSLVATEIVNCLLTLTTVYQTSPPIPVASGLFISNMQTLFSNLNPSGTVFAINLSNHIHTLCSSSIINGVIPGSPPIPFSGPII